MSEGWALEKNKDLIGLNTFGISSIASEYAEFSIVEDLLSSLDSQLPIFILGGGSNLLLSEQLEYRVLRNCIGGIEIVDVSGDETILAVGGGVNWHNLVTWSVDNDLGGLENLALIPGTVGAAPIQNIGAYGVELKDVFHGLQAIELTTGQMSELDSEDCQFGYRTSIFKNQYRGQYCITKVFLKLKSNKAHIPNTSYRALENYLADQKIKSVEISDVFDAVIKIRRSKLPDPKELGNSGSFFKNAVVNRAELESLKSKYSDLVYYSNDNDLYKVPTGWLIEKVGWKGKRIGPVGCYEKQSLVLVNHGGATSTNILDLAHTIIRDVENEFGIKIEPEVNIL
jgi:UDP-N-acetylmuramate dehydrogenase